MVFSPEEANLLRSGWPSRMGSVTRETSGLRGGRGRRGEQSTDALALLRELAAREALLVLVERAGGGGEIAGAAGDAGFAQEAGFLLELAGAGGEIRGRGGRG